MCGGPAFSDLPETVMEHAYYSHDLLDTLYDLLYNEKKNGGYVHGKAV